MPEGTVTNYDQSSVNKWGKGKVKVTRSWSGFLLQEGGGVWAISSFGLPINGHEYHETCHSVIFYIMKKDSKRYSDTTTPESIHTKDESKRGFAFAFIFGVN